MCLGLLRCEQAVNASRESMPEEGTIKEQGRLSFFLLVS